MSFMLKCRLYNFIKYDFFFVVDKNNGLFCSLLFTFALVNKIILFMIIFLLFYFILIQNRK